MPGNEFSSIIRFMGDASQIFSTIDAINSKIQGMGQVSMGGGTAGGGNPLAAGLTQTGQAAENAARPLARLGATASTTGYHWEGMIQRMLVSMFVWQGVNTVMNAVGDTMTKVGTETSRLDDASARLSVTLGTSKEAAQSYAQAYAMMGAAYGMAPAESLPQAQYAARVARTPIRQEEMFNVSAQLARVTGEDPKKLIDDLNVTYKQTGISITQLGDMAVKAWANSGTSAGEYLNILREVGPLAISSGIDIERMAGIAAQAADRMGGSMSDAANTLTRLIKAVQQPNAMQFDVLTKYGIKPGGDVQQMLDQVSKANMSAMDLAALGGRPGMPAVANDIRTMIAVFKDYNGELSKGTGLQDDYTKATDSLDGATKRLAASWDVLLSSFLGVTEAKAAVQGLADVFMDAAKSLQYLKEVGLPAWMSQLVQGATTGSNYLMQQAEAQKAGMLKPYTGGMYQPGMQGQTTADQIARPNYYSGAGFVSGPNQPIVGKEKMIAGLETGTYALPTSATDISKYTQAQVDAAMAMIPQMMQNTLQSYRVFLEALGIPPDQIAALVKAREESIQSAMEMYQSGGRYSVLSGAPAYFLKQALGTVAESDTKASRQKDLEDRLKELTDATYESTDATKKANQLQGLWNIPGGARILAPISGAAMRRADEEGGGDTGYERWRRNQDKLIEKARKELEDFMKGKGAGGGLPPEEKKEQVPLRAEPTAGAIARQMSREDRAAAVADMAEAARNSMATLGGRFPLAPQTVQSQLAAQVGYTPPTAPSLGAPGIGASDVLGKTITSAMSGLKTDIEVRISATPINITSYLILDNQVIYQQQQKVMVQQVTDQARSTGYYAGPTAQ